MGRDLSEEGEGLEKKTKKKRTRQSLRDKREMSQNEGRSKTKYDLVMTMAREGPPTTANAVFHAVVWKKSIAKNDKKKSKSIQLAELLISVLDRQF